MAVIAKRGTPSLATALPPQNEQISGLRAGETVEAGDLCAIGADGLVVKRTGAAKTRGIAAMKASIGEAVTLYRNVRFGYGSGLTPNADVFESATAGAIDDAGAVGTVIVGFVVDATRVQFTGL